MISLTGKSKSTEQIILTCPSCGTDVLTNGSRLYHNRRNGSPDGRCKECSNKERLSISQFRIGESFWTNKKLQSQFIGFYYTDGCCRKGDLYIASTDLEYIEEFKRRMQYTGRIVTEKGKDESRKDCHKLYFYADNRLKLLSLVRTRDKDQHSVVGMSLEEASFVQGLLDGDGMVARFLRRDSGKYKYQVRILLREKLAFEVRELLSRNGIESNLRKRIITKDRKQIWDLDFNGPKACRKIMSWLVNNAEFGMKRKRDTWYLWEKEGI